MTNDLSVFDSKHYNGRGSDWKASDTALATAMASVPLFFIILALTMILPHLIWFAYPAISIGFGQVMRKGVTSHKYYGLTESQVDTVVAIESLPDDVRSRYGDNYVEHVKAIGSGRSADDLSFEVKRLAEQAKQTETNRREHEMAPIVEAMKETTREISIDLKKMDPGPLQLTRGKSEPRVDMPRFKYDEEYNHSSPRY